MHLIWLLYGTSVSQSDGPSTSSWTSNAGLTGCHRPIGLVPYHAIPVGGKEQRKQPKDWFAIFVRTEMENYFFEHLCFNLPRKVFYFSFNISPRITSGLSKSVNQPWYVRSIYLLPIFRSANKLKGIKEMKRSVKQTLLKHRWQILDLTKGSFQLL